MKTKISMTEEELEERLQHSSIAGHHVALEEIVGTLRGRAGDLFSAGRDGLAEEVRRLMQQFEARRVEVSKTLDAHIIAARKKDRL